ncbi:MAG TPA: ABC transporter substrate-binding protein [Solirubrobacterales bacterium]|nr:ABC transporter substrate-binding protein [Solirubrobacterales bacterium]
MKVNRWFFLAGATALLALVVLGCGGGSDPQTTAKPIRPLSPTRELDITIDGYPGPENVGILMAYYGGYFEKLGLSVWIRTPQSRMRPLPYVAEEEVALAVSHQPQVVLAGDKEAPVAAFGSLVSQPTAALMWPKKSKIGGIAGLKGKTIAITGLPFEKSFLESVLARGGLTIDDVKLVYADYELVPTLLSGQADAIFGSWNVEGVELEKKGLQPVIKRVQGLGIPSYEELVLIARPERLAKEQQVIRTFMAALARGTAAAIEDPEAAARLLAKERGESLTPALKAEVQATVPLLSKTGEMDPEKASGLVAWMHEQGMIEKEPSASELFSNDYLPPSP